MWGCHHDLYLYQDLDPVLCLDLFLSHLKVILVNLVLWLLSRQLLQLLVVSFS